VDPNDKSGALGDGSAKHYIAGTKALTYNVAFENEPKATAPASQVVVSDQLDPAKVNLNALTLGAIQFGGKVISVPTGTNNFNTTYSMSSSLEVRIEGGLDTGTGLLKWTFTSIDPSTGLPPTDPSVGFLPPDVNGIEGQGSVIFNVLPKPGQETGTQFANTATVVFDANAPISTPTWVNTFDVTPPVSKVASLPATVIASNGKATFKVSWSGTDVGSGVASYTIYVSDNGGAFKPWQTATRLTSASYTGEGGHTYGFYSIATDNAGNAEPAKKSAGARTDVLDLKANATLKASTEKAALGADVALTVQFEGPSKSDPVPVGTVEFYYDANKRIGTKTLSGGKAAISTRSLPLGNHTLTAVYSGDPVYPPKTSAPVKITITRDTPAVRLISSANPSIAGSKVTFTATVTGSDTVPTGSIEFYVGGKAARETELSNGKAIFSTTTLTVGTDSIKAIYAGNPVYVEGTSNTIAEKIDK